MSPSRALSQAETPDPVSAAVDGEVVVASGIGGAGLSGTVDDRTKSALPTAVVAPNFPQVYGTIPGAEWLSDRFAEQVSPGKSAQARVWENTGGAIVDPRPETRGCTRDNNCEPGFLDYGENWYSSRTFNVPFAIPADARATSVTLELLVDNVATVTLNAGDATAAQTILTPNCSSFATCAENIRENNFKGPALTATGSPDKIKAGANTMALKVEDWGSVVGITFKLTVKYTTVVRNCTPGSGRSCSLTLGVLGSLPSGTVRYCYAPPDDEARTFWINVGGTRRAITMPANTYVDAPLSSDGVVLYPDETNANKSDDLRDDRLEHCKGAATAAPASTPSSPSTPSTPGSPVPSGGTTGTFIVASGVGGAGLSGTVDDLNNRASVVTQVVVPNFPTAYNTIPGAEWISDRFAEPAGNGRYAQARAYEKTGGAVIPKNPVARGCTRQGDCDPGFLDYGEDWYSSRTYNVPFVLPAGAVATSVRLQLLVDNVATVTLNAGDAAAAQTILTPNCSSYASCTPGRENNFRSAPLTATADASKIKAGANTMAIKVEDWGSVVGLTFTLTVDYRIPPSTPIVQNCTPASGRSCSLTLALLPTLPTGTARYCYAPPDGVARSFWVTVNGTLREFVMQPNTVLDAPVSSDGVVLYPDPGNANTTADLRDDKLEHCPGAVSA